MNHKFFDHQSADEMRRKITEGMDSIRAGQIVSAEQVKAAMGAFKRKAKKFTAH